MWDNFVTSLSYMALTFPIKALAAVISYFCGCINGAILISKHYLKE